VLLELSQRVQRLEFLGDTVFTFASILWMGINDGIHEGADAGENEWNWCSAGMLEGAEGEQESVGANARELRAPDEEGQARTRASALTSELTTQQLKVGDGLCSA
jgi:hypothetical protein